MQDWILFSEQKPEDGQHVYYFFNILGIFEGYFEISFQEELGSWEECFYGKHGWLGGGEVTHWMPYTEERPSRPVGPEWERPKW